VPLVGRGRAGRVESGDLRPCECGRCGCCQHCCHLRPGRSSTSRTKRGLSLTSTEILGKAIDQGGRLALAVVATCCSLARVVPWLCPTVARLPAPGSHRGWAAVGGDRAPWEPVPAPGLVPPVDVTPG
jgi:hypothetical protein